MPASQPRNRPGDTGCPINGGFSAPELVRVRPGLFRIRDGSRHGGEAGKPSNRPGLALVESMGRTGMLARSMTCGCYLPSGDRPRPASAASRPAHHRSVRSAELVDRRGRHCRAIRLTVDPLNPVQSCACRPAEREKPRPLGAGFFAVAGDPRSVWTFGWSSQNRGSFEPIRWR